MHMSTLAPISLKQPMVPKEPYRPRRLDQPRCYAGGDLPPEAVSLKCDLNTWKKIGRVVRITHYETAHVRLADAILSPPPNLEEALRTWLKYRRREVALLVADRWGSVKPKRTLSGKASVHECRFSSVWWILRRRSWSGLDRP